MGITEIFWLFLIFSTLQPVIRQKILEANRMRLLAKLGKERGSLVISLVPQPTRTRPSVEYVPLAPTKPAGPSRS